MIILIVYISVALGFSFLCSVLEAVLLSISPSYIASENEKGHRGGKLWLKFKADIDQPLAAILSLNTIAHTVGAAGAGAQATRIFGEAYFGVISAILTLLILIISEIIPKTLGAVYWRQLAPVCARTLQFVLIAMYPLAKMAQSLTRLLSKNAPQQSISRDEFQALAELGAREGVFSGEESAQVASMMRFRSLVARDVMTPRPVVFALDENLSVADALKRAPVHRFSRIPLYSEHPDEIQGFIRKDAMLQTAIHAPDTPLASLRRDLPAVIETRPVDSLLRWMVEEREQIVMVINEYGSVLGIVTTEDLVETLLGMEIVDETDHNVDMQALARSLWRRRARRLGLIEEPENP